MTSPKGPQESEVRQKDAQPDHYPQEAPDEGTDPFETPPEADEDDLDEAHLQDDERWDVFILDDDGDPLPDYGDFWFPD